VYKTYGLKKGSIKIVLEEAIPLWLKTKNKMSSDYHQDRISNYIKNFPFPSLRLIVRDLRKAGQLIEVHIKNKKLKCIADDDFDCIHVGFALALPEVRMALKNIH
jgi:hypothetical protein